MTPKVTIVLEGLEVTGRSVKFPPYSFLAKIGSLRSPQGWVLSSV